MTTVWKSLYSSCADRDRLVDLIQTALTAQGYELYDPFSGMPGKIYQQRVGVFIAPANGTLNRLLTDSGDEQLAQSISTGGFCLYTALEGQEGHLLTYDAGAQVDPVPALSRYLRPGLNSATLQRAMNGELTHEGDTNGKENGVPLNALPDDIQQMAKGLNDKQISKMFDKVLNRLGGRFAGDEAAARDLLRGADWHSKGGQRIEAVMRCLNIAEWQTPDFASLRSAYQLRMRLQRKPDAPIYPGDEDTMNAVPNALDYVPVYGGKNT